MSATVVEAVSKGEFATIMGVTAGRVSQWIKEGKIGPDAMVGDGHRARIIVDRAKEQIAGRTDPGQRFGNGLKTMVAAEGIQQTAPPPAPLLDRPVTTADQLAAEKLKELRQRTRRGEEEERARRGLYTPTAEVQRAMGRLATDLMSAIEGGLPAIATDLSARFALPQRDLLHALRESFRDLRERAAREQTDKAAALPPTIIDGDGTMDTDEEDEQPED